MQRRRIKQTVTLEERLAFEAFRLRDKANRCHQDLSASA